MNIKLNTWFIFNPNNKPIEIKPIEVDIIKAKISYFYPNDYDLNRQINLVGYSEGIIKFFDSLNNNPNKKYDNFYCLNLEKKYHVIKKIEKDYYLNIVFDYQEPFKIKKNKNKYSLTLNNTFINNNLLKDLLDVFYDSFRFFYGDFSSFLSNTIENKINFIEIMTNFLTKFFNLSNDIKVFDLNNIVFNKLKRLKIKKSNFIKFSCIWKKLKVIENSLEDIIVFENNNFIFSTIEYSDITIINYIFFKNNLKNDYFKNFFIEEKFDYKSFESLGNSIIIGKNNANIPFCYIKINNKYVKKYISCLHHKNYFIIYFFNKNTINDQIYEITYKEINEIKLVINSSNYLKSNKNNIDFIFYNKETCSYSNIEPFILKFNEYPLIIKNLILNYFINKNREIKLQFKKYNIVIKFLNNRYFIIFSDKLDKLEFQQKLTKILNEFNNILI